VGGSDAGACGLGHESPSLTGCGFRPDSGTRSHTAATPGSPLDRSASLGANDGGCAGVRVSGRARRTVSVVIPVKDDAALLARCLEALARQTRLPDEIIVVDNNSSDDSALVAVAGGARVVNCAR